MAVYPGFKLQEPNTTLFLAASRAHPIALYSAVASTRPLQTYPLIHPPTETYLTPLSLLFLPSGDTFYAGTSSLLTLFSLQRREPLLSLPTIPSTNSNLVGGGVGVRGLVGAMAVSSEGLLAIGTYNRGIGIYDAEGQGDVIAVWNLPSDKAERGGKGVTGIRWSGDGRYLFISERGSHGVMVYDVRVEGREVGWLAGREADTNQRLSIDVFPAGDGNGDEIWAGGRDGQVRMWRWSGLTDSESSALGRDDGRIEEMACEWTFQANGDPVGSVMVHPSGLIVATCSGQRRMTHDEDVPSSSTQRLSASSASLSSASSGVSEAPEAVPPLDNSLKIWLL